MLARKLKLTFNLKEDIAEQHNVIGENPAIEKELYALLVSYIENGRSTPSPKMTNDAKITIEKEK